MFREKNIRMEIHKNIRLASRSASIHALLVNFHSIRSKFLVLIFKFILHTEFQSFSPLSFFIFLENS